MFNFQLNRPQIVPVTWIKDVGWGTIPAIGIAAFCLLGILEIGREIENPFGYDFNDLVNNASL